MASKSTILIVDDDPVILQLVRKILETNGYSVTEASDGIKAIALSNHSSFDLTILDMHLPGLSGIEVAQHLGEVPFLFLSAETEKEIIAKALANGALGYIFKPFDADQFLVNIEAALHRSKDFTRLRNQNTYLQSAQKGDRSASVAIGLLIERFHYTEDEALATLKAASEESNTNIEEVAGNLIESVVQYNALSPINIR